MVAGDGAGRSAATEADERERVDAVRRRVLNVIGHELRTPVTTIHGLAASLATADETAIRTAIAPALVRSARRLERLLDDLLIASEISTALPVEPREAVTVASVARKVWAEVSTPLGRPDGEMTFEGDGTALVAPGALRLLLERVLENAARYGHAPMVTTVATDDGRVRIEVDTPGPDLHPEEVELALEPFFRGERAVMTSAGIGVGLSVARSLAEHAGGRLTVRARHGGGLVTVVELETP